MVGLKADRKRILKEYSKGMRQRIGLAQALINDPDLVILDEPTSGLDPLGTRWMKDLIVELRDQGKTVIMCSHRLEDVQDVCDRIAILNEGELQAYGEVKTLLQDVNRVEMRASGVQLTDDLRRDLEEVLRKHGGKLDFDRPSDDDAGRLLPAHRRGEQGPPRPALPPRQGRRPTGRRRRAGRAGLDERHGKSVNRRFVGRMGLIGPIADLCGLNGPHHCRDLRSCLPSCSWNATRSAWQTSAGLSPLGSDGRRLRHDRRPGLAGRRLAAPPTRRPRRRARSPGVAS